ncbi:MAG: hypothetical protein R3D44_05940 [Hyphomicrobiaceae bacterium]
MLLLSKMASRCRESLRDPTNLAIEIGLAQHLIDKPIYLRVLGLLDGQWPRLRTEVRLKGTEEEFLFQRRMCNHHFFQHCRGFPPLDSGLFDCDERLDFIKQHVKRGVVTEQGRLSVSKRVLLKLSFAPGEAA